MSPLTVSCWSSCTLLVGIEIMPTPFALSSKSLSVNCVVIVLFSISISPVSKDAAVTCVVTSSALNVARVLTVRFCSIKTSSVGT